MVVKAAVVLLDPQAHVTLGLSRRKSATEAQDFVRVSIHVSALLGHLSLALEDFLEEDMNALEGSSGEEDDGRGGRGEAGGL